MDEVNYDWDMYINMLDNLMAKLVQKLKQEAALKHGQDPSDIEIEIDNSFFKQQFIPSVH